MPRPKLPTEEKKGMVLRTRTTPSLYYRIKNQAELHGWTLSEEIVSRLEETFNPESLSPPRG